MKATVEQLITALKCLANVPYVQGYTCKQDCPYCSVEIPCDVSAICADAAEYIQNKEKYKQVHKSYSDSTLKSMTKENLIGIIRCLEHNISALQEMNDNQFKLLMSKDERAEKYKRHDLRKNPDDLPTMCYIKRYDRYDSDFVEFMYSEEELPIVGYLRKKNGKLVGCEENWRTDDVDEYNVIAWREIEPLEEDER